MRIHNLTGVLAAAAVAGALLAGCGNNTTTSPATTPPPATSSAPAAGQQHNQADVVFLQNMIPHHTHAIRMSQVARNQATSPQVKDLAARIETAQSLEIQQMRDLLTAWGQPAPATPGGRGPLGGRGPGPMPGMMTGVAFDQMFLQMMIFHHQGAIDMSQTELTQGSNPAARELAQRIINTQQAEINEMQTLLQQI
ncbi:MAG: DUF305 domain-containing protein [Pseudonocardiaceae bacterium]